MPESRHRYLFGRLGDHNFQQLVAALLAAQFLDFVARCPCGSPTGAATACAARRRTRCSLSGEMVCTGSREGPGRFEVDPGARGLAIMPRDLAPRSGLTVGHSASGCCALLIRAACVAAGAQ